MPLRTHVGNTPARLVKKVAAATAVGVAKADYAIEVTNNVSSADAYSLWMTVTLVLMVAVALLSFAVGWYFGRVSSRAACNK